MDDTRQPVLAYRDGRHQVQPEENEVGEIVTGQRFSGQVGVDEPQPSQPPPRNALALQVRQLDAMGVPHPPPR